MIKLVTLFSGIGAIEQTLLKMGLEHKIIFACDKFILNKFIEKSNSLEDISLMEKSSLSVTSASGEVLLVSDRFREHIPVMEYLICTSHRHM